LFKFFKWQLGDPRDGGKVHDAWLRTRERHEGLGRQSSSDERARRRMAEEDAYCAVTVRSRKGKTLGEVSKVFVEPRRFASARRVLARCIEEDDDWSPVARFHRREDMTGQ